MNFCSYASAYELCFMVFRPLLEFVVLVARIWPIVTLPAPCALLAQLSLDCILRRLIDFMFR